MGIVGALPQAFTGGKNGLHHHPRVRHRARHSVRRQLMDGRRLAWLYLAILPLLLVALLSPGRAHASGSVAVIPGNAPAAWSGTGACAGLSYAGKTTLKEVADTCANYLSSVVGGGGVHWVGAGGCGTTGGAILFKQYNWGGFAVGEGATPADGWVNGTCGWTEPAKPGQTAGWDNTYTLTNSGGAGGAASCPANATGNATPPTACTCSTGYQPNPGATACVQAADKCADKLGVALTGEITIPVAGQVVPGSACVGSCTYVKTFDSGGVWGKLNGSYTYAGKGADFIGNGASCTAVPTGTGSPTDPGAAPLPNPPPKGMCPGTVNAVSVNVPCDSTSTNNPGPTGTGSGAGGLSPPAPGASGGAADPGAVGAPGAGSFSPSAPASAPPNAKPGDKATNGTCTGDKCAQTECVVVLKADFSMQKECGTTYEDKATYCKNKPGDPNCADVKNTFAGSCDAPVSCTGDAIQCQVARQQLADSCDARKVSEATGAIYTGLKGTGVAVTGLDSSFNIGNMLPAGPSNTCALTDTTIALYDQFSVSLPLGTLLCDKLGVIRGVIAAFGFVMWSIIVFGLRGN